MKQRNGARSGGSSNNFEGGVLGETFWWKSSRPRADFAFPLGKKGETAGKPVERKGGCRAILLLKVKKGSTKK